MATIKSDEHTTDIVVHVEQTGMLVSAEVKELLEQAAKEQSEAEHGAIPFLSIKGKKFSLGDEKLGTSLTVIILADIFDHAYYDKDYDPDVISPPACFAIGEVHGEMVPSDDAPAKQYMSCTGCPQNEFGSARHGTSKGKACRNGRRLLLASVADGKANFDDMVILNLPPTSLKTYSRYAKNNTTYRKLPIWAIVTKLTFDENSDWPSIVPLFDAVADNEDITIIASRLAEFKEIVSVPYDCSGYIKPDVTTEQADTNKKSKMS